MDTRDGETDGHKGMVRQMDTRDGETDGHKGW